MPLTDIQARKADISADVTTMFRVVRKHYEPLVDERAWVLSSRDKFERLRCVDPHTLTDIEHAARFLVLQRLSFCGKVIRRTFGVDHRSPGLLRLEKLRAACERCASALPRSQSSACRTRT